MTDARHYHLEHIVPDAARIAAIRHRIGKSSAHPELTLRLPQQQAAVRRLVAAGHSATTVGDYCAAGFRSGLCRVGVKP